jgi:hypothetical protein
VKNTQDYAKNDLHIGAFLQKYSYSKEQKGVKKWAIQC